MDTSDNGFGSQATAFFKSPTTRKKGYITIESRPFTNKYSYLNNIHNAVLDYVRDPNTGEGKNGFRRIGFSGRSASQGVEKYVKEVDEEELNEFKSNIYSMPASSTFIKSGEKELVDDYVNYLVNEMERMTTYGGKRTKKRRRGKKSRKGKSKKRYSRRR